MEHSLGKQRDAVARVVILFDAWSASYLREFDLRVGYKFSEQARVWLDILNLFNNTGAHQIDYFYPSQLASETAPVYDVHFKPVEPISARLTFSITF
jgi:hypothetical protein